jgi:endoglucanase
LLQLDKSRLMPPHSLPDAQAKMCTFTLVFVVAAVLALITPAGATDRLEAFRRGTATTKATADLRRGISFGNAMDAPKEGDWGWTLSASDFRAVRKAGFDHVRVPMRISAHAGERPPYTIHARFLERMDWVIAQALSNDLGVVVDMHHYDELMQAPQEHADRLVGLWRQITTRYRKLPKPVVYEILNEPTGNLTAEILNPLLTRTIAAIRAIDRTRTLIIEGANWSSAQDLRDTLEFPPGDKNIVASFHMYAPHHFTHQGAHWMPPRFGTLGVVFPGPPPAPLVPLEAASESEETRTFMQRYNSEPTETNPSGPAAVIEQLDMAKAFADRTGQRVYLGEFGAIVHADLVSRARWTRLVRTEAEKRGFGWAYWDFCQVFAAFTPCGPEGRWVPEIKAALLE